MAALTLLALVSETGQLGVFFDFLDRRLRHLFEFGRQLIGVRRDHGLHIFLVFVRSDLRLRTVGILNRVVAPRHLVVLYLGNSPGMQVALNLAGLGVHQRTLDAIGVIDVALTTGAIGNPDRTRIRVIGLRPVTVLQAVGGAFVGFFRRGGGRIAAMTGDAPRRIAVGGADGLDLNHHGRVRVPDVFDAFVTGQAARTLGKCPVHHRQREQADE